MTSGKPYITPRRRALPLALLVAGLFLIAPSAASAAQFFSATGAIEASDPTHTDRPFRADPPDTCASTNGVTAAGSANAFHYDLYSFNNITNGPVCVTVTIDPMTCTGSPFLGSAAYVPSFDPAAITANGVADIGASPQTPKNYSFTAPPGNFAVNVHEIGAGGALCPAYGITLYSDKPFASARPTITGTARVGETLTGGRGTWNGNPTFTQQWRRCDASGGSCVDIPGATSLTYTPTAADVGATLRVRVSATHAGQTSVIDSAETAAVAAAAQPPPDTDPPETTITK